LKNIHSRCYGTEHHERNNPAFRFSLANCNAETSSDNILGSNEAVLVNLRINQIDLLSTLFNAEFVSNKTQNY
jgi:hypothetical protein